MSELESVLAILDRMKAEGLMDESDYKVSDLPVPSEEGAVRDLMIENSKGRRVGYSGFFTVWGFDAEGKCVSIGSWE